MMAVSIGCRYSHRSYNDPKYLDQDNRGLETGAQPIPNQVNFVGVCDRGTVVFPISLYVFNSGVRTSLYSVDAHHGECQSSIPLSNKRSYDIVEGRHVGADVRTRSCRCSPRWLPTSCSLGKRAASTIGGARFSHQLR